MEKNLNEIAYRPKPVTRNKKEDMTASELEDFEFYYNEVAEEFINQKFLSESKENCDIAIKAFYRAATGYNLATWYSDSIKTNPYYLLINSVENLKEFIGCDYQWDFYEEGVGMLIVSKNNDQKIIFNLSTGRWRVQGKNVWYYSKSPTDFLKKYCN